MMHMEKFDIEALRRAFKGESGEGDGVAKGCRNGQLPSYLVV